MNVTNLGLTWNSRYLELSPTEMGIAIVAALLVGGAALYILLKVLRSKPVKLLGMTSLVAGIALVGWLALDQHQQELNARASPRSGAVPSKTALSRTSNPASPTGRHGAPARNTASKS